LSGSSKTITVFAQGNAGIAGIQVVEVLPPVTSDPANWLNSRIVSGPSRIAVFDRSKSAVASVDQNFTLGSLRFSNANHSIVSGAGNLALLQSAAIPEIFVDVGRTATIGATMASNHWRDLLSLDLARPQSMDGGHRR
jgi:hypothetical protein